MCQCSRGMMFVVWINGLFLLSFNIQTATAYDSAENHNKDCILDHDHSNSVLEQCEEKGYRFVKDYMRILRRDELDKFGTCQNFHPFGKCIRDLWARCPTVQQVTYPHWKPIVDLMTNACNQTQAIFKYEYHHKLQCLENEMSSVLVHRCDGVYDFNIQQKTRDKCVFLKEAIQCKTALVTTACDTEVGEVAYLLSKINAKKLIEKSRCYVTMTEPYYGFRYDDNCQWDFKDDLQDCYTEHIEPHEVNFASDNDLIISGTKRELREACSAWRMYRSCIRPIKEECKQGVEYVYEEKRRLRVYLLKLEYICKEEKEEYMDKLPCLHGVLKKKYLDTCTPNWDKLKPYMEMVSSYQYYCESHNKNAQGMQEVLESIRLCYEQVYSEKCGMNMGSIMSELIRRAFSDPFYLRLDYIPDCSFLKDSSSKKRSKPHVRDSLDNYERNSVSTVKHDSGLAKSNNGNLNKNRHHHSGDNTNSNTYNYNTGRTISNDISLNKDMFLTNQHQQPQQSQDYDRDFATATAARTIMCHRSSHQYYHYYLVHMYCLVVYVVQSIAKQLLIDIR